MKKYEGVYFLADQLKGDDLGKAWANVKSEITKLGGVVLEEKLMGRRAFAKPLRRQEAGNYMEIVFDLDPDKVDTLRKRHKLDSNVFRVMIVSARKHPAPAAVKVEAEQDKRAIC